MSWLMSNDTWRRDVFLDIVCTTQFCVGRSMAVITPQSRCLAIGPQQAVSQDINKLSLLGTMMLADLLDPSEDELFVTSFEENLNLRGDPVSNSTVNILSSKRYCGLD